jgi:hypothetical protein
MPQQMPLLAMVALNTPTLPSPAALKASFNTLSGIAIDLQSLHSKDGNMVFDLGNDKAGIALMSAPIPWANLEGPCATAYWWPDAAEKMKKHTSHILIALVGEKGNLVRRSITLTHLTAAIALNTDVAGIYWGGGALVHEPRAFIEQAKNLSSHDLPLNLWVDFRLEPNEDGSHRLFTTGMRRFNHEEIEIVHSTKTPAEIIDFACSIANYVITSEKTIQNGETIGRSEEEKATVQYVPSMLDSNTTVMQLDF